MTTHPVSTPTFPGAPRRFRFNPLFTVVGTGLLLAGVVAFSLYVRNSDSGAPAAPQAEVAAPISTAYFTDSVDRRSWTFYVVASEEQAAALKAGLAEADAMRYVLGEPWLLESVYVAESAGDAAAFTAAVTEGNRTLAALGLAEDRVLDLRGD